MPSDPSRCVINGRFLTQHITGVQRYAFEIASRLAGSGCGSVVAPPPKGAAPEHPFQVRSAGRLSGHLWEQLELPALARDRALVNLCNTAPLSHRNQVVAIHDAAIFDAPAGYSRAFVAWYRFLIPRLCRGSRRIVTVSEFSKARLVAWCGADPGRIEVVPNGVDHMDAIEADPGILARFGLKDRRFVLGVGSLHPNKNLAAFMEVAETFADRGVEFVVAGGANPQVFAQLGVGGGRVRFLGYVSDRELKALYQHAACFLFPSRYEGFGIPPLEAMRCGCPVVASNAASLPEVCGAAALYAPPDAPGEFGRQLTEVLGSQDLRQELIEKGKAQASRFTWASSSQRFAGLLPAL